MYRGCIMCILYVYIVLYVLYVLYQYMLYVYVYSYIYIFIYIFISISIYASIHLSTHLPYIPYIPYISTVGIDWNEIISSVAPQHIQHTQHGPLHIIAYYRSNIVKAAISGYSGRLVKQQCGTSNLKSTSTSTSTGSSSSGSSSDMGVDICSGDSVIRIPWTPIEFCNQVNKWQVCV